MTLTHILVQQLDIFCISVQDFQCDIVKKSQTVPISPVFQRTSCKRGLLPKSMFHKLHPWDYKPSSLKAQEETQETLQK